MVDAILQCSGRLGKFENVFFHFRRLEGQADGRFMISLQIERACNARGTACCVLHPRIQPRVVRLIVLQFKLNCTRQQVIYDEQYIESMYINS